MKRAWMSVIAVLIVGALPLACGKPTAEGICQKGAECGKLKEGITEQQCVDNANQNLAELRAVAACAQVADATEESLQCAGGLSCTEFEAYLNDETGSHKCNEPIKALSIGTLADCNTARGQ